MTMPVILYYLLKDGNSYSFNYTFIPDSQHKISVMLHEMNQQVKLLIFIGQYLVAIFVGITYTDIRLSVTIWGRWDDWEY